MSQLKGLWDNFFKKRDIAKKKNETYSILLRAMFRKYKYNRFPSL